MNDGKICVSVCAETADEMFRRVAAAGEYADIIEIRFDSLKPGDLDIVLSKVLNEPPEKPVLFTLRPADQGGMRDVRVAERLKFWERVLAKPPVGSIIDIEAEPAMAMAVRTNDVGRIVSWHDFKGVPADLNASFDVLATALEADIVKIAVTAAEITDTIGVWKLIDRARETGKKVIPIAMGEAGKWTRVLGLAHGAYLTYASLDIGGETAPGQVTAEQLAKLYRVRDLDLDTKVFGILGDPVSQSLSTFMHNPAFVSEGVNGVFIPFLIHDIDAFMRRMVRASTREIDLNFGGFSVTMPHKQSIMKHLDEIDPTAAQIGAVNTVKIRDDGTLIGFNTDAHGFITPLKKSYGDLVGARAAVFGAGGASRACIFALLAEKAEVVLFVRNVSKASLLSEEFGVPVRPIDNFLSSKDRQGFDILVDATPIGMSGPTEHQSLFTSEELKGVKFVYDLVTKPYDTPIIREAKAAGIPTLGGLEMLVAQGAKQFKIWTGCDAPVEQMKECVLKRFDELNK
jgi:3-dehydroquinate dehydratase / shikimate dehydrogenase